MAGAPTAAQLAAGQGVAAEFALPAYLRDKVELTLEEKKGPVSCHNAFMRVARTDAEQTLAPFPW